MIDLFAKETALTPAERKKLMQKAPPLTRGHAWTPGTGPQGETCGSCQHLTRLQYAKVYMKCRLIKSKWTNGPGTDVRVRDPACKKWEAKAKK